MLNGYYGLLGDEARSRFHARYSKIFRDHSGSIAPGQWIVHFNDREIRLPLRPSWAWLDWDIAASIVGHDIEVIQTYATLMRSEDCPSLFLDVGANYGMHSLLFLSAGIQTIAFEPNPHCLPYFQTVCELNGLMGRWEQVAVGAETGQIELVYPERNTWLGSAASEVVAALKSSGDVVTQLAPLKKLDAYLSDIPIDRALIKIDVEGFEREVIEGASQVLRNCRPKVIFESNDVRSRPQLFRLFADCEFSVYSLPWQPSIGSHCLRIGEFLRSTATNFIAIARSA